ncbi:uncharacterized protein LOC131182862 [Hevea brasiliensis]|uniref:uncharacterized protein LOC131182862 n=1 Tax=Hevea brasiliensis TaxID=3981 RepID=UPI0025D889DE|nr:uncharacterized protein LOC131182862 [Hevea brasiliensis]
MKKPPAGVYELDAMSMFNAKFDALTRKMDKLSMKVDSSIGGSSHTEDVGAGNMHCINDFPSYGQEFGNEQVDFVGNYNQKPVGNPFSATYNPAWRNHPNFSWGGRQGQQQNYQQPPNFQQQQQNFQQNRVPPRFPPQRNQNAPIPQPPVQSSDQDSILKSMEANKKKEVEKEEVEKYVPPPPYKPPLPYPQRFQKAKQDKQFEKFLKVLKKLYINIPFTDAIFQMPSYAKFLKEILSNKKKLEDYETVALTEECNAILHNKLPPKLKDPGSFSISCHIGETSIEKALCDLGASVSLMPLSICEKLKVGDLKSTTISLQLADRSIKYPVGILENMPLKVGNFFILVDFVVLEMEDVRTPIILGRPFLATAGANIDVKNGKLKLKVGEEEIEFNLFQDSKESTVVNSYYRVDVIENDIRIEDIKLEGSQITLHSQCNQHTVRKKKSPLPLPFDKNETPRVKLKAPSK